MKKVEKATNGDTRFGQLKDHIANMRNHQLSCIALVAMRNPSNRPRDPYFKSCVEKFTIFDGMLDRAEEFEVA